MPAILLSFKLDFHKVETFFAPLAIIFISFVVGNFLKILIRRYIRKSARVLNVDPTNYSFLQNAVSMVVFLAAVFFVFWSIPELHDLGKTLFAGAGIFAAILGFASQEAFSNIISGIFIVIYKPFSVGDNIKLLSNSQAGTVEDITLRHTILKSIENRRIVIPNSVISREQILNSNIKDQRIQLFLEVVITYESKHNRAMEIMKEEALKHPLFADARTVKAKMDAVPPVEVSVIALDLTGVKLRACIWTNNDSDAFHMKCDLLKTLKERFEAEKIELARENDSKNFRRH
jgi:small-conductance mechanosensitive channel